MAGIFIYPFDWYLFNKALDPPATEPATRIARSIQGCRKSAPDAYSGFPKDGQELVDFIAERFAAEDWYEGKTSDEMNQTDTLVHMLFFLPRIQKRALKVKVLGDSADLEVYGLATGALEVVEPTGKSRRGGVQFRPVQRERTDRENLLSLGCRPHRFAGWDRDAASEAVRAMWQGLAAGEPATPIYWPTYSIHSPEQVATLFRELSTVHESLRDLLEKLSNLREAFESGVFRPIETAVKSKQAVYAVVDT